MFLAGLEGFCLVNNIKHLLGDLTLNVILIQEREGINFDGETHISLDFF